ncbi:hypothetical protein [Nocardia asiatica]|uniref:hypothetical protein n=1 Tax=Nocardia asiatica TaxID=209252 RepID=UPI002455A4EA|nr:hypothetical protein [Nocardia asiatica]
MSAEQVTSFVAHYSLAGGESWDQTQAQWREIALQAWIDAAEHRGITVAEQQILEDPAREIAVVEVSGESFVLMHLGRGTEVQAVPL